MSDLKLFVENIASADPKAYGVYPDSINTYNDGNAYAFMAEVDGVTKLIATCPCLGVKGERKDGYILCDLTHENAIALRNKFPFTAPRPVLREERSFGVGDRLGIACPGHIKVFEKYDAMPVFAQQSIRELDLTNRTYEDVLDCVTFAVFRDGFKRGFGADGDHLKRAQDVEYALGLGFSMITLDCSEHIVGGVDEMSEEKINAAYKADKTIEELYLGKKFDIGEGIELEFTMDELKKIVIIYGEAIDFAVEIYTKYFADGKFKADFEVSIDETATPTTPLQHFFVANELTRRGVKPATVAPRFCGEFQKGIDYIGDIAQFEKEMTVHSAIARHFGYKISVHSGSDKFSVFPIVGEKNRQVYHVKTAGTNWLEAMRVVAKVDPTLYRAIHKYALTAFDEATKYYHVTTDLTKIADVDTLTDEQLPELFNQNDARQLIHITYGLILNLKNEDGSFAFKDKLYKLWKDYEGEYSAALVNHIGRHLELLGCPKL